MNADRPMSRAIPHRGQGHRLIVVDLICGHVGQSETATDGRTPVRFKAWCVTCAEYVPLGAQADPPACIHTDDDPGRHWDEDTYGNDVRIDCACPCPDCGEY